MKLILILGLILSQAPGGRQSAANSNRRWHAAIFRGMTVGKSKRADMLRLLGEPKWSRNTPGEDEEHGTTWNHYERIGEFPGLTNVANDSVTGTITRIEFYPDRLTRRKPLRILVVVIS